MNWPRVAALSLTTFLCFVLGFAISLSLHWSLRPTVEQTGAPINDVETLSEVSQEMSDLIANSQQLKSQVLEKETILDAAQAKHDLDQAHARSLVSQLNTYRDERNQLFTYLEEHKQQLREKVTSLEETIQARMDDRASNSDDVTDIDRMNRIISLLSYPHALNDNASINTTLQDSAESLPLVEARFDLMLTPERYDLTEKLEKQLGKVVRDLNEKHNNSTLVSWIHCSESNCEIQSEMQAVQPYHDYWQEWLDALKTIDETKRIEYEFSGASSGLVVGSVVVRLP